MRSFGHSAVGLGGATHRQTAGGAKVRRSFELEIMRYRAMHAEWHRR